MATEDQLNQLKEAKSEVSKAEKDLKLKEAGQARSQKKRDGEIKLLQELEESNPDVSGLLRKRPKPGRPRIEDKQPELLKTIVDIATYGSGADQRRRSDTIRTVMTLEELTRELQHRGYRVE